MQRCFGSAAFSVVCLSVEKFFLAIDVVGCLWPKPSTRIVAIGNKNEVVLYWTCLDVVSELVQFSSFCAFSQFEVVSTNIWEWDKLIQLINQCLSYCFSSMLFGLSEKCAARCIFFPWSALKSLLFLSIDLYQVCVLTAKSLPIAVGLQLACWIM